MPKGLKIPIGKNASGGFAIVDGDDNDLKLIAVALGDDDNENAFQQGIGLGIGMVFDINDAYIRGSIKRRVIRLFKLFEAQKRFKLLTDTVEWKDDSEAQELILSFRYLNLESDEENEFSKSFSAGG
jgi:inorganic pyrophosphatase